MRRHAWTPPDVRGGTARTRSCYPTTGTPSNRRAALHACPGTAAGSARASAMPPRRLAGVRIATWNVNSVAVRIDRSAPGSSRRSPTCCACRSSRSPADASRSPRSRRVGYAGRRPTATAAGTAWRSCPGSGSTTSRADLTGQPAFDGVVEPRAIGATCGGCASGRSTSPTDARSPTRTTPTSSRGSTRCGTPLAAELATGSRSCSSATSTSRRPTTTSGTAPPSWADARHRARAGRARPRCEARRCVDVVPRAMKYDTPVHLLGLPPLGLPTRTWACASTWSTHRRRSPAPSPTPTSTARRASRQDPRGRPAPVPAVGAPPRRRRRRAVSRPRTPPRHPPRGGSPASAALRAP